MSIKPIIEKELAKMSRAERLFLVQYILDGLRKEEEAKVETKVEEGKKLSAEHLAELGRQSQRLLNGIAEFESWGKIRSDKKNNIS